MKHTNPGNVWDRAWRLIWILFAISVPVGLGGMLFDARLILVVVGLVALMAAFGLWVLRCPSCEKLILNRLVNLGGRKIEVPFGFPEKRCSRCGRDLTGRAGEE